MRLHSELVAPFRTSGLCPEDAGQVNATVFFFVCLVDALGHGGAQDRIALSLDFLSSFMIGSDCQPELLGMHEYVQGL